MKKIVLGLLACTLFVTSFSHAGFFGKKKLRCDWIRGLGMVNYQCGKLDRDGVFDGWAEEKCCREHRPTLISWLKDTSKDRIGCAELTPSGGFIRWVAYEQCRS